MDHKGSTFPSPVYFISLAVAHVGCPSPLENAGIYIIIHNSSKITVVK